MPPNSSDLFNTSPAGTIFNNSASPSADSADQIKQIEESAIFDLDFYNSQLNTSKAALSLIEAISHYLQAGATQNLDPHPLFDTEFYINSNKDIDFTHLNPLIHFINNGWQQNRNPHPLFDVQYYLDEYRDVCKAKINPLQHFIIFGAKEHRHPSESFDAVQYKKRVHDKALRQFFSKRFPDRKSIKFVKGIKNCTVKDTAALPLYLAPYVNAGKQLGVLSWLNPYQWGKISPIITPVVNPLLHFLSEGLNLGILPFASFDLLYDIRPRSSHYCKIIPRDLNNLEWVPLKYAKFAQQINKSKLTDNKLAILKELIESLTFKKNTRDFMQSASTILLVSHQAAYTGSPMLLLEITKALSGRGIECLLLLEQGGDLEEEFSKYAHIINFKYKQTRHRKCSEYLSLLFDNLRLQKPDICLLNSVETGHYAKAIDEQGIKIISLVHEIVDSYPLSFLQDVFARSKSVIFPAHFVQNFAHQKLGISTKPVRESIIPNALLEDSFGNYDRQLARNSLREQIEAPANSLIVLACGSPDLRKGIDYFVTIAKLLVTKWHKLNSSLDQLVHFVWLGASKQIVPWSAHYYVDWDVRQENLQSKIHLLPPQKDLRPIFHGADVFVLPSRQDPFPIVVHNAMAAALPIVGFRNAGGVPEMIEGGGAKLVDYGDILGFAQAIEEYLFSESTRNTDGNLNAFIVADRFRFSHYFAKLEAEIKTIAG